MTAVAAVQQTITPAAPVQLSPPQSAYGSNTLVLDNLSGYLLQVNVGPDQFWHPPLVEDAYDVTTAPGVPVTVTAVALPGDTETSGTLAPTWYSELLSQMGKQYPIALSGPAEIAAAIVASGLPIVFTSTLIGTFTYRGAQLAIDVHRYGSLIIAPKTGGFAGSVKYEWQVDPTDLAYGEDILNQLRPVMLPVLGPTLLIEAGGTQPWTFDLFGTNQRAPFPDHAFTLGYSNDGFVGNTGSIAMIAGTSYPINTVSGQLFQGPAACVMRVNVTTVAGYLFATLADNSRVLLLDTNGLSAAAGGTLASKQAQIALPANLASLNFQATASGTQEIFIDLVPAH